MPDTDRIPDALVLAAAKRAQLHQDRDEGVAIWQIKAHLELPHNGWTTRQLRPTLDALEARGLLEQDWVRSHHVWAITTNGRRRAARFSALPEAPQHAHWREARARADDGMDEFRREAGEALAEAARLLENGGDSDAWFEMGELLRRTCRDVGKATYCLGEWAEPDDARPDLDDRLRPDERCLGRVEQAQRKALRAGRRNIHTHG